MRYLSHEDPPQTIWMNAQAQDTQLSAASRIFSATVLRELSRRGASPLFSRLVKEAGIEDWVPPGDPVCALFDEVFAALERQHRNEYVFRAALTHKILLGVHSLKTATMLGEFRVGGCKADVVVLNGTSTVYEIKSERDKLDRLRKQTDSYLRVFARVNVITVDAHLSQVHEHVEPDVGILVLTRRGQISTVREPTEDLGRIMPEVAFASLQLHESRRVLELLGVPVPEVPNTQLYAVQQSLFSKLDGASLHAAMLDTLKRTRSNQPLSSLLDAVPRSLQPATLTTPMRRGDHARLVAALNTPVAVALGWD